MRFLVVLNAHVFSEACAACEAQRALGTGEGFFTGMYPAMPAQTTALTEFFAALVARKRLCVAVVAYVLLEVA